MPVKARTVKEALTADRYTVADNGCWIWNGSVNSEGYGHFYAEGRSFRAHRAMYELRYGPLPSHVHTHHLCRNPSCINPDHLEAVDRRDHPKLHRDERPLSPACPHGHPRTPENFVVWKSPRGGRQIACRVCDRERKRARFAARAAA